MLDVKSINDSTGYYIFDTVGSTTYKNAPQSGCGLAHIIGNSASYIRVVMYYRNNVWRAFYDASYGWTDWKGL